MKKLIVVGLVAIAGVLGLGIEAKAACVPPPTPRCVVAPNGVTFCLVCSFSGVTP